MDPTPRPVGEQDLWRQYRLAFEHFSQTARTVQMLRAEPDPDSALIEKALFELERARVHYSNCRDILAYSLMLPPHAKWTASCSDDKNAHTRVKRVAELLWELEGKRDGRSDDHWFRAERIVHSAQTSAV